MHPFNYSISTHTVLVGLAMAAACIVYTYAVSYVWAKWRQGRQERERFYSVGNKPVLHCTCSEYRGEHGAYCALHV